MSSITQIGVATVSDELLAYIKEQIKNGTIDWTDITDTPDYAGKDGKYLKAHSSGGSSSISWESLPAAGLSWQLQSTNVTATDKVGFLASGGITITLPESPIEGTLIAVADHSSEFDTSPVTVISNDSTLIEGDDELILDLRNTYVQLVFSGTQWELAQVNHPFNVQEITEESFPGGSTTYTLSRVPPNRSSILITNRGYVVPTTSYNVIGNALSFGTAQVGTVYVRHIGVPSSVKVSDTPIGAMLYFPNGEPVDGWLDCTGASIGRSVYPDLVKYLTKNPDADIAYLPDSRGNFIRSWDSGTGLDSVSPVVIPSILKYNEWGKWLDTIDDDTAANLFDGSTLTKTNVKFDHGYVGYRFDAPVVVDQINIVSKDTVGLAHLPTSMQLKCSSDGITWILASVVNVGPFQDANIVIPSIISTPYRYWAVFGTGGVPYTSDESKYWGVASLVFTGYSTNRTVGSYQNQTVGPMNMTLDGSAAGVGQVQSGSGATVPLSGRTGDIKGGAETRPNNRAYVLRIKAFHSQSGGLSDSSITALRDEISRLSERINDGTSYVSASAPPYPTINARWYDTTSGRTYIWFNDGDSYQWVDDSPQSAVQTKGSLSSSPILATNTTTARNLNDRFADISNILDFGAFRNSGADSKSAFDNAGVGPIMVPSGSYYISYGNYEGNTYFSLGPVVITGGALNLVIKDITAEGSQTFVSTVEPTASDGSDGDMWFVTE